MSGVCNPCHNTASRGPVASPCTKQSLAPPAWRPRPRPRAPTCFPFRRHCLSPQWPPPLPWREGRSRACKDRGGSQMPLGGQAGLCHSNSRGQDLDQPPNLRRDAWQGLLQPHREDGQEARRGAVSPAIWPHSVPARPPASQAGGGSRRGAVQGAEPATRWASSCRSCLSLGSSLKADSRQGLFRGDLRKHKGSTRKRGRGKECTNERHPEQVGFSVAEGPLRGCRPHLSVFSRTRGEARVSAPRPPGSLAKGCSWGC